MSKDPVISVRDLLAECIRKMAIILLCAVICAAALCGFKYYKDKQAANGIAEAGEQQEAEVDVELTDEQQQQVLNYVNAVEQQAGLKAYLEHSIYINCNPYHMNYVHLQYNVDSESELELREAVLALRTYILGGPLANDLSVKDGEVESKYFIELIRCESITHGSYMDNGMIEIIMYAESKERAQTYGTWINESLENYMTVLNNSGIECELEKIAEQTLVYMHSNLLYDRSDKQAQMEDIKNKVSEMLAQLTPEQVKAANMLLAQELEEENKDTLVIPKASINVKYFILGGILGCVLGVCIIAVYYIFTNTIKVSTDVQNMFGVTYLGGLSLKKRTVFDKLADKLFYPSECFVLADQKIEVVSKILFCCKRYDIHHVYMLTNGAGKFGVINEIAEELSKHGVTCSVADNLLSQMDAVKAKNIILVNQIQKTKYQEIENEILFYKNQDMNVLGYVTVK